MNSSPGGTTDFSRHSKRTSDLGPTYDVRRHLDDSPNASGPLSIFRLRPLDSKTLLHHLQVARQIHHGAEGPARVASRISVTKIAETNDIRDTIALQRFG